MGATTRILFVRNVGQISCRRSKAARLLRLARGRTRTFSPPAAAAGLVSPIFSKRGNLLDLGFAAADQQLPGSRIGVDLRGRGLARLGRSEELGNRQHGGLRIDVHEMNYFDALRLALQLGQAARIVACWAGRAMAIRLPVFGSRARRTSGMPASSVCSTASTEGGSELATA